MSVFGILCLNSFTKVTCFTADCFTMPAGHLKFDTHIKLLNILSSVQEKNLIFLTGKKVMGNTIFQTVFLYFLHCYKRT